MAGGVPTPNFELKLSKQPAQPGARDISTDLAFRSSDYAGGDDGERRLWYVALTRSAKFLNISSLNRSRKKPTDYFNEIHHHIVRRDGSDPTVRPHGDPRPPDDAAMLPTTFSDLTYRWRCPHEYQLRSLMGFGPGVGEQYGYGQQLHNILAEIHDLARAGRSPTLDEVEQLVSQRFHLRYTQGKPLDALKHAAKQALVRYVRRTKRRSPGHTRWRNHLNSSIGRAAL